MKTWLITGCSSGIGAAIAKAVLASGDNAVVTARKPEVVADIVKDYPETSLAVALDVTDVDSIKTAVDAAVEKFGTIDVLINNAGYGYRCAIEEGQREDVDQLFNTNVFGTIDVMKAVLPLMRAQRSGIILNVSSIAAYRGGIGSGYYASSKAALEIISDVLQREVEPLGIKVGIIEPGGFRTDFYTRSLHGSSVKISDYDGTAGPARKENVVDRKDQPGDPDKAGAVIVDLVKGGDIPMRLLMGKDTVIMARKELQARLDLIDKWADVSAKTDY